MKEKKVRVSELLEDCGEPLDLRVIVAGDGLEATIGDADIGRPGLLLAGFEKGFRHGQVQVLDGGDLAYVESLSPADRKASVRRVVEHGAPCMLIAEGLAVPDDLLEICSGEGLPVISAGPSATQVIQHLNAYLLVRLAPESSVNGTLVDVYGVGILLTGKSGIGKSECAVALVERGHRLVADDLVRTISKPPGVLIGRSSEPLQSYVEVRGIGLVDIGSIFGIRALRRQKRIEVEVALKEWTEGSTYDRSGLETGEREIMGVRIPSMTVPLVPGKSVSVIVEVIALSHILKSYGYDSAGAFNKRWIEVLQSEGHRDFKSRDIE
jgi:HPr kinase/phosphorylase